MSRLIVTWDTQQFRSVLCWLCLRLKCKNSLLVKLGKLPNHITGSRPRYEGLLPLTTKMVQNDWSTCILFSFRDTARRTRDHCHKGNIL